MIHRLWNVLAVVALLAFAPQGEILAQDIRATQGGGSSFGQSGFGQSGGLGSFGQGGFGQSAFGQGAFGQGAGQSGASGQTTLRSGDTGFVGRDIVDIQTFFEALGRQSLPQVRPSGASGSRSSGANDIDISPPPVRVKLRMNARYMPSAEAVAATRTSAPKRIGRLMTAGQIEGTSFEVNAEGVAHLTGSVANEDEARLAEAIASIEPGVTAVRNALTVRGE